MRLLTIPRDKYDEYRLDLIFDCYKWDPQFQDNNTVAKHVLVLTKEEHEELKKITEELDKETIAAERYLNENQKYTKILKLPKGISKVIKLMKNYDSEKHVRLMRYDFHPTIDGWNVSEVNSDVPGGFAEASLMPQVAKNLFLEEQLWHINFGDILTDAITKKVKPGGRIMLVHCTSYSDDRQVMEYLGDKLETMGFEIIYGGADHVLFKEQIAHSVLYKNEGPLDGIFRFTPLEWLKDLNPKEWDGYYDTVTPSCNHPIAILAQTKRFPFVWDRLELEGLTLTNWKRFLPKTIEVKDVKNQKGFIYKPASGRVGENISIREACKEDEYEKILKDVRKNPDEYIAQKKFISVPVTSKDGEKFHVCLGSYTVEGKHAGYYARISETPRIDSRAADIPVLIEGSEE